MPTTLRGIFKSLKHITQIFVVKERELEIGYPTDVKHVAHVGWDDALGAGPSWMNEFERGANFTNSLGNLDAFKDPNQESQQSSAGVRRSPEKPKQTRIKSASSSQSLSSSAKQSRAAKAKATYRGREATPIALV